MVSVMKETHTSAQSNRTQMERDWVTDCSGGEEGKLFSVQLVCLQDCHGSGVAFHAEGRTAIRRNETARSRTGWEPEGVDHGEHGNEGHTMRVQPKQELDQGGL